MKAQEAQERHEITCCPQTKPETQDWMKTRAQKGGRGGSEGSPISCAPARCQVTPSSSFHCNPVDSKSFTLFYNSERLHYLPQGTQQVKHQSWFWRPSHLTPKPCKSIAE